MTLNLPRPQHCLCLSFSIPPVGEVSRFGSAHFLGLLGRTKAEATAATLLTPEGGVEGGLTASARPRPSQPLQERPEIAAFLYLEIQVLRELRAGLNQGPAWGPAEA